MITNDSKDGTNRRKFLGSLATGAAAIGFTSMAPTIGSFANTGSYTPSGIGDPEEFFKKINGKHRVVFDAPKPHEMMPFAWPLVYLMTNEATGTPNKDCSVVVVLRHSAICYAMEDRLWEKYNFSMVMQAPDPNTGKATTKNPFWKPKPGAFVVPGIGEVKIGIDQLQERGVMFCVCEAAITVYSAAIAQGMNADAVEVRKDFMSGIFPGIQPVPSGVWALGRAQEHQCTYIFAG